MVLTQHPALSALLVLFTILGLSGVASAWEVPLPGPCATFNFPDDTVEPWLGPPDGRYCATSNPNCPIVYYGPDGARCYTS